MWLACLLGGALAAAPPSVLDDVDLARLEAFALENPSVELRQAELRAKRREVTGTQMTPVQGLNVGTGLVEGDEPGSGPQLGASLWLSINAMDIIAYPNRVRIARANKDAAQAALEVEERAVRLRVLEMVNVLRQREAELQLAEEAVAGLEVQTEAAQKLFLNNQLSLEQLTAVEGQLLGARRMVIAARSGFQLALHTLENLTGHPLADAKTGAP